ncbi:MAG TPA: hypothetical protein VEI29_04860 [Burkholderiaceae bacterium]|nr:hypothetical protein [Burkholderiaceae bacterium]
MKPEFSFIWQRLCNSASHKQCGSAAFLATLLLLQALLVMRLPNDGELKTSAGTPPDLAFMRLASLDEAPLAGYATALYLQAFDAQAGAQLPLRLADFRTIRTWLELAFALNPKSGYPLMLGAFEYAETAYLQDELLHPVTPQAPAILDFVERGFRADPGAHWPWLVHACWIARYRLHDEQRASAEAQLLRNAPNAAGIPQWARELDLFLTPSNDPISAQREFPARSDGSPESAGPAPLRPAATGGPLAVGVDARSRNAIDVLLWTSFTSSSVQTLQ